MSMITFEEALSQGLCFYGYRIPGSDAEYGTALPGKCHMGIPAKGFVISPFLPGEDSITIPFGNEASSATTGIPFDDASFPEYQTSKGFYLLRANELIEYLRNHPYEKIVYSRMFKRKLTFPLTDSFKKLCDSYPNAYVYCFSTPWTGTWMGASPELLAKCNNESFHTVALAGTTLVNAGGRWSEKNKREQQVVADFIRRLLHEKGLTNITEENLQLHAGPVKHLLTNFYGTLTPELNEAHLVEALSPTPAIAGYPREKAIAKILRHEAYPRGCYGGYSGPRFNNRDFEYWVTLRCMRIRGDECAIFAGGGLMPDSIAENEWTETENKAATLDIVTGDIDIM